MILPDVNVLVYAAREDADDHVRYAGWLASVLNGTEAFGVSDLVMAGVIRVLTHPRIFQRPSTQRQAFEFVEAIRERPQCVQVAPGERHWSIFRELCSASAARGGMVHDAFLAAIAIETGSEWITTDRDFSRFPGLRWRHPIR